MGAHDAARMQVHAGASQINRRSGGRYTIYVEASGIEPLTLVVIEIEFNRHAMSYPWRSARVVWPIPKSSARRPDCSWRRVLQHKNKTIAAWICSETLLKGEVRSERLNIEG